MKRSSNAVTRHRTPKGYLARVTVTLDAPFFQPKRLANSAGGQDELFAGVCRRDDDDFRFHLVSRS